MVILAVAVTIGLVIFIVGLVVLKGYVSSEYSSTEVSLEDLISYGVVFLDFLRNLLNSNQQRNGPSWYTSNSSQVNFDNKRAIDLMQSMHSHEIKTTQRVTSFDRSNLRILKTHYTSKDSGGSPFVSSWWKYCRFCSGLLLLFPK